MGWARTAVVVAVVACASAGRLAAGEASPDPRVVESDESSRAVAYWRVWLGLRPRVKDAGEPLARRIELLNAFLAHSPDEPWAEQPRAEAARILERLVGEWRGQGVTRDEGSPSVPSDNAAAARAPTETWNVGRYNPDSDDGAVRRPSATGPKERRLLFDVAQFAYSAPLGAELSLGRLRWSTFQLQLAAGGGDAYGLVHGSQFFVGILGLGARLPLGEGHRHEIGFLTCPLSLEVYGTGGSPDEDGRGVGFGFVRTRLYYRYDFDGVALETAVSAPLGWTAGDLFEGAPPVMLTLGVALGRTR